MSRDIIESDNSRRNFLLQSTLPFAAALTMGGKAAFASSLLEDFGGTDFKNFEVKKTEVEVTPKSAVKGESSIDPTLKGSKFIMHCENILKILIKLSTKAITTQPQRKDMYHVSLK